MPNPTRSQSVSAPDECDQKALSVVFLIQNLFKDINGMVEPTGQPGDKVFPKVPDHDPLSASAFQKGLYDLLRKQEKEIEKGFFGRIASHYHFRSMEFIFLKKMHVRFIEALELVHRNHVLLKAEDLSFIPFVDSILYAQLRELGSKCSWHKSAVELSCSDLFRILPQKMPIIFQNNRYEIGREVAETSLIPYVSRALQVENRKMQMQKEMEEETAKLQKLEEERTKLRQQLGQGGASSEPSKSRARSDAMMSLEDMQAKRVELEARLAQAKAKKQLNHANVSRCGVFSTPNQPSADAPVPAHKEERVI